MEILTAFCRQKISFNSKGVARKLAIRTKRRAWLVMYRFADAKKFLMSESIWNDAFDFLNRS